MFLSQKLDSEISKIWYESFRICFLQILFNDMLKTQHTFRLVPLFSRIVTESKQYPTQTTKMSVYLSSERKSGWPMEFNSMKKAKLDLLTQLLKEGRYYHTCNICKRLKYI